MTCNIHGRLNGNCLTLTGEFPFAKCFVCGEMGHLSRSCPDNPKGVYADGEYCYPRMSDLVSQRAVVFNLQC